MPDATCQGPSPQPHAHAHANSSRLPRQRSNVVLWLWLVSSLLAILCFLVTWAFVSAAPLAIIYMWIPFLIGIGLLLLAVVFAVAAVISFLGSPSGKSPVLSLLCVCAGVGSLWGLVKAASAMWAGAKTAALFGAMMLAMTPWGAFVVCTWAGLAQEERVEMQNSLQPKWRMVQVEYAGANPPESPENISFTLTNTGPHAIAQMDGHLHVWNSIEHAKVALPVKPEEPLNPGGSIRLNFPLDENGRQVFNIVEGVESDHGQPAHAATQAAEEDFHLRYQLHRLTSQDGDAFEIRSGNLEPLKCAPAYGFKRALTNPEWGLVKVEYLGMQTAAHPGRAAFGLRMPDSYRVTWLKGKLQVIDIEAGHVEKEVQLNPEGAMAPGESAVFALPAGKESQLADKIITGRSAYDRSVGNKEQTSHIVRFQLQKMKTVDGQTYAIDWLGELKDE